MLFTTTKIGKKTHGSQVIIGINNIDSINLKHDKTMLTEITKKLDTADKKLNNILKKMVKQITIK